MFSLQVAILYYNRVKQPGISWWRAFYVESRGSRCYAVVSSTCAQDELSPSRAMALVYWFQCFSCFSVLAAKEETNHQV